MYAEDTRLHNCEESAMPVSVSFRSELHRKAEDLFDYLQGLEKIKTESEVEMIILKTNELLQNLPGPTNVQKILKIDAYPEFVYDFAENQYEKILSNLIEKFDVNFPLRNGKIHNTINQLFAIEELPFFIVSFETLLMYLKESQAKDAILTIITNMLDSEGIFVTICSYIVEENVSDIIKQDRFSKYELFVQALVSLPNTVANVMEGNLPHLYKSENYCSLLVLNIVKIMEFFSDLMCFEKTITLNFQSLSLICGKIIVIYRNCECLKDFIKILELFTNCKDKCTAYKAVITPILRNLQKTAIETLAVMILQNTSDCRDILSDSLIQNKDWQFVLCKKIPLLSYYNENDVKLIYNVVIYLNSTSQQELFELFLNLLTVWSDKFAITHTSFEQHLYITKFIIVVARHLNKNNLTNTQRNDIQKHLYRGIPAHLECGIDKMRAIGMIVGEIVSELISNEDIKLQFEYDKLSKDCQDLSNGLKNLQQDTSIAEICDVSEIISKIMLRYKAENNIVYVPPERKFRNKQRENSSENEVVIETGFKGNPVTIIDSTDFELDSDDDLEPYDISNDVKVPKKPPPAYLRDLRDGLLETQDAELFALSVENCEKLVLQQLSNDDASVGLEILEILITLAPTFYVENFDNLVFRSSVAITCTYPVVYADFLCKQFHADTGTYSICHRVFMLDVLKESARTLSALKLDEQNQVETTKKKRNAEAETAELIIKKRLETKTRRFITHKSNVFHSVNRFSDVAGWFFFPLIYGYGKSKFIPNSSTDDDSILLINFLQTLSVIMCSAQNCAVAPKMARELFNLSWFLRFHKEAKVRMAVLSMIAAGILNVPKTILLNEFTDVLLEMRFWLMDLINPHVEREPNSECRTLGVHVMCILEEVLKVDTGVES